MFQSLPLPPSGFDVLTVKEQIDYVKSLWDYIATRPEQVPVPGWHKQILDERLSSYKVNPSDGQAWEEVEEEIFQKLKVGIGVDSKVKETMPVISMFYGIIVLMYYFDNRRHQQSHIHVQYGDEEAVISIPDGEVIEGSLRRTKLKLVQAWVELHRDELMADWTLAVTGQPVFKIDPLR